MSLLLYVSQLLNLTTSALHDAPLKAQDFDSSRYGVPLCVRWQQ